MPQVVRQVINSCNLKFPNTKNFNFCYSCQLAKSHKPPFVLSDSRAIKLFDLVHFDL